MSVPLEENSLRSSSVIETRLDDFGRRLAPGTRPGVDYHVPPQGKWPVRVGQMNSNAWITRTNVRRAVFTPWTTL
jgi:hypothetical protein